jgi:hypothetical protein
MIPKLEGTKTPEAELARRALIQTLDELASYPPEEAQWYSKNALDRLADAAQVALLYDLAHFLDDERYARLAAIYARRFIASEPFPARALSDQEIWLPPSLS